MAEPNKSSENQGISAIPHNWQALEPNKMVEVLLEVFDNSKEELNNLFKTEINKIDRILKSGRAHNTSMLMKKLKRIAAAQKLVMR
ncbi:hypothetical protein WDW89_19555 [Deltaproteobacteria bacterium TL4]